MSRKLRKDFGFECLQCLVGIRGSFVIKNHHHLAKQLPGFLKCDKSVLESNFGLRRDSVYFSVVT